MNNEAFVNVSLLEDNSQLTALRDFYIKEFGLQPDFYARVPGRVNIIGEHIDYCGYPVLPMALDQCIILAVGRDESSNLRLKNFERNKFKDFECDLKNFSIELPQIGGPEWYKYFLCGVKGIYKSLEKSNEIDEKQKTKKEENGEDDTKRIIGMNVALFGNIPPASGLSSSSALVSAAALATAHLHGMPLERKNLAAISASCERYIGTQGGGMDQAIAYLAKEGCAQFIEFHPKLNATPIRLPDGACFVVANSLAEINKAATSDFNERVVECRLASRIVAKRMELQKWRNITRFADLQAQLDCTLDELEQLIQKFLPNEVYTQANICAILDVSDEEFANEYLTANTLHMEKFKLRQRALHVVQESIRVAKFRDICEELTRSLNGSNGDAKAKGDSNGVAQANLARLSQLMRESHESLKDLYECSHPHLDRLIEISDDLRIGARLTGAGWGGCIVALCDSIEASDKYIQTLKEQYFSKLPSHLLTLYEENDFKDVVFATVPRSGAEIIVESI